MRHALLPILASAALAFPAGALHAAVADEAAATERGAGEAQRQPLWEAGVFAVGGSQQAYPGASQRVNSGIVLPFLVYRGSVLRAEQGTAGLRALQTPTTELDIGVAGSFGSSASRSPVRRGLPDIGTLIEFGPRLRWKLGTAPWGGGFSAALPARGVFDVSDGFRFKGTAVEPVLAWGDRAAGWSYGVSASLLLGDRHLGDTFYGVAPAYATATRPAWEARAGLIATRLSVNASRGLGRDWRVFTYARVDTVEGAANRRSPLVDQRTGVSAGLGLSWTWLRSDEPARP